MGVGSLWTVNVREKTMLTGFGDVCILRWRHTNERDITNIDKISGSYACVHYCGINSHPSHVLYSSNELGSETRFLERHSLFLSFFLYYQQRFNFNGLLATKFNELIREKERTWTSKTIPIQRSIWSRLRPQIIKLQSRAYMTLGTLQQIPYNLSNSVSNMT